MTSSGRRSSRIDRLPSPAADQPARAETPAGRRRSRPRRGCRPSPACYGSGPGGRRPVPSAGDRDRRVQSAPAMPGPRPEDRPEPLGANRDFKVLLGSQGVSSLGDAVSFTALPLLVLALTGSGLAMGIVGALQTLPDLVFGMVAGAIADRHDRQRMMFLADLGRGVLTALIPLSVFLGGPTMVVILRRRGPDQRAPRVLPGRRTPRPCRRSSGGRRSAARTPSSRPSTRSASSSVRPSPASWPRPSGRVRPWPSTPCRSACRVSRWPSCVATCAPRSTGRRPACSPRSARASTSSSPIRCCAR